MVVLLQKDLSNFGPHALVKLHGLFLLAQDHIWGWQREMKPSEQKRPQVLALEAPGEGCATRDSLTRAPPCFARHFHTVQRLQQKQELSFAKKHHQSAYSPRR